MAVLSNCNFLLVGSVLGAFFMVVNASPIEPRVQLVAEEAIRESLPAHLYDTIFGQIAQLNRFKREIVWKKLTDENNCVRKCSENHTKTANDLTAQHSARLALLALQQLSWDEGSTPGEKAEHERKFDELSSVNMGPMSVDMCAAGKQADICYLQCPNSQLRNISIIKNRAYTAAYCEPGRNWNNFTEYWNAVNCTNTTEAEKPCDERCGDDWTIDNAIHFGLDTDISSNAILRYENDPKVITTAVGPTCKSILCKLDCYKPIMTRKCGAKAYDMYRRMTALDPRVSLFILKKEFNVVVVNPDCKAFQ